MSSAVWLFIPLILHLSQALDPSYGAQEAYVEQFKNLKPGGKFQCLSSNKVIKTEQVNDDYCDCPDGSDEPGTSACTAYVIRARMPDGWMFSCSNIGFKPQEIPHNRVNDGLCDCCDGSDEHAGIVQCSNICAEVQERQAKELMREGEKMKLALERKQKMIEQAKNNRQRDKISINDDKAELETTTNAREEMLKNLSSLEEEEKVEKGRLAEEFAILRNVTQNRNDKEGDFKLEYRANCTRWFTKGNCDTKNESSYDKGCDELIPSKEFGYCECIDAETNATVVYEHACGHNPLRCSFVCKTSGRVGSLSNEDEKHFIASDGSLYELPEARDLRKKISEVEDKLKNLRSTIESKEARLKRNLNTEDIIRTLADECFSLDTKSYTYKLCPFKDAHQNGKGSDRGKCIGKWGRFGESTYSLWSSTDDHTHMLYEGGDWCWNQNERITDVRLVCGSENKLLKAEEPIPCKYAMVFQTPAICE